jgi:hypothetical protein
VQSYFVREIIRLLSVMFYLVKVVHKSDVRLVINDTPNK